jgi:hypothetical protein
MLELAVSGRQDCSLFCCIPGAVFPALPPVEESLMKPILRPLLFCFSLTLFPLSLAAAVDWAPVTDAERAMTSNPLDPGSGAIVLFKRGHIDVTERTPGFWITRITTYVRIKVLTDAGRDMGNRSVESPKWLRFGNVEGRTILPSGEIVPLDSSKVFHGRAFELGKRYAVLKTTFAFSSVQPGAILEYQTEETADWFYPPPWIFDTEDLATLQSTLRVTVGPRLALAQDPIDTTVVKITASEKSTAVGEEFDYSVANLRPTRREPYAVPFRDQCATVVFSPYKLGFSGQVIPIITNWNDVGNILSRWLMDMTKKDSAAKNQAKEVAEKLPGDRQRAEAIYQYLQRTIVSDNVNGVALARTADEIVDSKRGDPDEINALFTLMLKEVKVDADPILLATKDWQMLAANFPNLSQFSRMITQVNLKEGPVVVDAAEAAAPFGVLPWPETGVTGFLLKGTKMQPVQIPAGVPEDNQLVSKLTIQLSPDWKIQGDEEMDLKGAEALDFRGELLRQAPEKLNDRLTDYFAHGEAEAAVSDIVHPDLRDSTQAFVLKAKLQAKLVDESSPGELLLNPWVADRFSSPLFKTAERHSAVRFDYPEKHVSTSTWTLPAQIHAASLPKEVNMDNSLGSFSHSCVQTGNTVTCTRTFVLKKTELGDMNAYLGAKSFFDEMAKHDQEVIVLRGQ